jgi:hypothetical protein
LRFSFYKNTSLSGVALTGNAEAIEDCARRVGAIEGVEVNSGYVVIQEIVTLFQGEVNPDATDHFTIVFATLQSAQKGRAFILVSIGSVSKCLKEIERSTTRRT